MHIVDESVQFCRMGPKKHCPYCCEAPSGVSHEGDHVQVRGTSRVFDWEELVRVEWSAVVQGFRRLHATVLPTSVMRKL